MKKRLMTMFAAIGMLLLMLPTTAFADESTTTYKTVSKSLDANTEIYAVTDAAGGSYPYYNALWEPTSGAYYGRSAAGGSISGRWGLVNGEELADESAFSFYYSLTDGYSLEYWSYIYGSLLDGSKAFLVNLNFDNEAGDCDLVLKGTYDTRLKETFRYLATLDCPVLMRIGGEVNCWTDMPSPSKYISAYQHIAKLARQLAPNVALVYSVNFGSAYGVDMDSFYPGDTYVDWIGVSLYYNRYANNGDTKNDAFYGCNTYADALLNVQQTVNLSRLHSKPIIITEGGSYWMNGSEDLTAFASERVDRALSYLTMVYPEIKCIIYSDADFGSTTRKYAIYNNAAMTATFDRAASSNPTLLTSAKDPGVYYTPLSEFVGKDLESVTLAAYTYSGSHLTAKWYVDGVLRATTSQYPYSYTLPVSSLTNGSHTIGVEFSNGERLSYNLRRSDSWLNVGDQVGPFKDVKASDYFCVPVLWVVEQEITNGMDSAHFAPGSTCTRGQVVTFLWRASGSPEPASSVDPFSDVTTSDYFYKAVLWAVENGITTGVTDTTFAPEADCTRGQVAAFLWRANGGESINAENPFSDVEEGAYYFDAVLWAVANNVTTGTSATTFSPEESCSRGQIVTFLYRTLK